MAQRELSLCFTVRLSIYHHRSHLITAASTCASSAQTTKTSCSTAKESTDWPSEARLAAPACPDAPPAISMSQRIGTIYPSAPGETGRQARARLLAEHATASTAKEANDRCRTPDDSTAEDKHSNHNRTNLTPRQAPAWAPFTFRGLSSQLRHAAHVSFVKARPARPTSTRLRSRRARNAPSRGSIVAQTKRDAASRGMPARCRTGRLEEPWHAQPNAPRPRTTRAATNG